MNWFNYNKIILSDPKYGAIFSNFLADPEAFLKQPATILVKGHALDSTTIFFVTIDGVKFVIKRYNVKNSWVLIKNLFRKSYAAKVWYHAQKLAELGINVPKPIAVLERHFGVFYGTSYFITEYIEGERGCDYFAAVMNPIADREQVAANIVDISRKLYQARLIHRDFQYGNMLIAGITVYLLDLEHLRQYSSFSPSFKSAYQKDVQHFLDFVRSNQDAYAIFKSDFNQNL